MTITKEARAELRAHAAPKPAASAGFAPYDPTPRERYIPGSTVLILLDALDAAEATIARLTAEVTTEESGRLWCQHEESPDSDLVAFKAALTAFIEGRKGGRVENKEDGRHGG